MLNPKTLFQHDKLNAFTLSEVEISNGRRVRVTEPSPVSEDKEPTKPKACRRNYPSEKKFRLVNAFTLSEVLIAIGIIGVVAALVIPNLMQTMQNRDLVSKYLKVNNTLTNAYKNAEAVNGYKLYNLTPEQFKLKFEEDLKKLAGNCDNEVCLTDGSSYDYVCDAEKCTEIIVDTNGKKKPNSAGKDRFRFLISEEGIKPQGEYTDYCGEIDGGMDCGRYILANHKLFDGLVNNCSEYSNGRCSTCEDGYSLGGNSCSAVNLANCERYSGVTCSGCSDGYMLKNGVCTSLSDNNCASTTDGETCEVCSNKYRNNNGVCEEIEIADCKTYSGDSCSECKSGQYKNNGGSCELQEVTGCKTYNNGECIAYNPIDNCDDQTNYTCNSCKSGNYLNANGSCSKIEVANCTSADVNGKCTTCKSEQYKNNGTSCELAEIEGCKTYSNGSCIAYNPIDNCADQTDYTCNSCSGGYHKDGTSCAKGYVENCSVYEGEKCKTCTNGNVFYGESCIAGKMFGDAPAYKVSLNGTNYYVSPKTNQVPAINGNAQEGAAKYCSDRGMTLATVEQARAIYEQRGTNGIPTVTGDGCFWTSEYMKAFCFDGDYAKRFGPNGGLATSLSPGHGFDPLCVAQ
ncbi:MAG: prepilin-type N-terminal cleavage/methylation domain-containing protein [Bacteroidales bacterium]|nr:prepilin-type N-terminal cleavage/methylation domain-containing protein [Bacteroidales bacterium]